MRFVRLAVLILLLIPAAVLRADTQDFFAAYCHNCHGPEVQEATLNLSALTDAADPDTFRRLVKVFDRLSAHEMPPADAPQPTDEERAAAIQSLEADLLAAEAMRPDAESPPLRRLTRAEYENTIRDLFDMPGIALGGNLPADGTAHGFDKHADALEISHVHVAKYVESADHILNYAIATRPMAPTIRYRRISLGNIAGFVAHVLCNGDGVLMRDMLPDPEFLPAGEQGHIDEGSHERMGSFSRGSTVGLFRHEDESFSPYLIEHVTIYPGIYRVHTSLWSFGWDKGTVLPARGTEAGRLSVVQLTGDGRGGQHPSYVLGYFDAPSMSPLEHELHVWLNHNEIIGFNTASLAPVANYARPGRSLAFTGPGIACDFVDVEGPLHEVWPPRSHQLLFGELPLVEFKAEEQPAIRPPVRRQVRQLGAGRNRPDPDVGLWTVQPADALADADRLLAEFLPRLFRRPVDPAVKDQYVAIVSQRLSAGECFETAMRHAYRTALCSPDFLYHVEPMGPLDDYALACRLSYFLWNSLPDEELAAHVVAGDLRQQDVLHSQVERLLSDARAGRFIEDFLGQWLKLRQIAANDPDENLYPEFSPYLQDAIVAETRAYFRELIEHDLDATHLVESPFVMVNQKLATHYGIDGVTGTQFRRVEVPEGCPRGGFLTQGAILKVTANGTTTSPVPRGAFVMDRILGEPPEPPPSNIPAIEPDVQGATTIREQLAAHRAQPVCASCHSRIDPPGFALESFDVIGGWRDRYRSIGEGDPAVRGEIDPFINIGFKLGPVVDDAGELNDGRTFDGIREYQTLLAADSHRLLTNLARQFAVYATGRQVRFGDRARIAKIVQRTEEHGGGLRTLLHEVIGSPLFTGQSETITMPEGFEFSSEAPADAAASTRMMMTIPLAMPDQLVNVRGADETPPASMPVDPGVFNDQHQITLRVRGLFMRERIPEFENAVAKIPEAKLILLDYDTAQATIAYADNVGLFSGASLEEVADRLHNRVQEHSYHTLGLKPLSEVPREQLQRVDIPIVGLDCMACSLAAYELLANTDGVEQATASFRDGQASAWIDPTRVDRDKLVEALTRRGFTVGE